ncbi:brct domain-containing protein at4g02110 [Phtheirospermum japonicum]|uniref:Brct domain-containing protein at4g02110 n=1 Tax=Phtheirospermum japonicum TaxID=374723 RepID=A0A830D5M7_9LAMI|nr:brct domain-containing protein at4g02110 [Phtheirospermum japonicum]
MLESKQTVAYDDPSKTFIGVRFVLLGFDSIKEQKVRLKLLECGGIDAANYGPDCNHVIVDKLVYDDPMCVAARRDGKTLVNGLWVDHSFDVGMPVDPSSVMYRPMKDLNGIPGAKSLVVCLTGYQRQDRDDIMTMVALMGANFSKPLVANKVTHLICYKFEGEKYELAKKMKKIKLVNHRWLEDCLKAWELLPEADYDKSGYELEMMAEAKDSEEETEDVATTVIDFGGQNVVSPQNTRAKNENPYHSPAKHVISRNILHFSASKSPANFGETSKAHLAPGREEIHNKHLQMLSPRENFSEKFKNVSASEATERSNKSRDADVSKLSGKSKSKNTTPRKPIQSNSDSPSASNVNKFEVSGGFDFDCGIKTPLKGISSPHDEDQTAKSPNHSKSRGGSKSPMLSRDMFGDNEGQTAKSPNKSKTTVSRGGSKSPMLNLDIGGDDEGQTAKSPEKSKMTVSRGGSKSPMLNLDIIGEDEGQTAKSPKKSKTAVSRGVSKSPLLSRDIVSDNEGQTVKSPNKSKMTVSRGSFKSPMLNLDIDCGIETPGDEDQAAKSASKRKTTVSRGGSKSTMSSRDPKILMESELVTKSVDISSKTMASCSGKEASLAPKEAVGNSRKRLKKQTLPDLETTNLSGGVEIHQSGVQSIEPPSEKRDSGMEKTGGQDDPDFANEENTDAKSKPLKRKLLAKKTLGSKRAISKASTTKLKGTLNLQKDISQNDYLTRQNRVVAIEDAVDDETQAPNEKIENEFVIGNNNEQLAEDESPLIEKGDINLENSIEAEKAVKKTKLAESKVKNDAGEKKIAKGKKRPLANAKKNKSKDSGEEVKKDEKRDGKESVSGNEENVALDGKTKKRPAKKLKSSTELEKENNPATVTPQSTNKKLLKNGSKADKTDLGVEKSSHNKVEVKAEPACFIVSGHRLQRKDFLQLIRRLKGKVCRDSHSWSYQATHFVVPDPIKRTEKFFAAAASGSWILKTDYLAASNEAGKLLPEEPYEWHKKCLTEDGAINLEAPRKWRLLREKTGHCAFYGMRIVIYGECIAPPLDTLKRVIKAGDGTILATSPPYTRFFGSGIDYAVVSPGMPRVDMWVQEFLRHEVPCVVADYLVEYVCKPGYSLDKHVQYNTHAWAQRSLENHVNRVEEVTEDLQTPQDCGVDDVACKICGSRDRGDEMLICGDESGGSGCGIGTHIDCLDPPLEGVPEEDWFCLECSVKKESKSAGKSSKKRASKSKR